MAQPPVILGPNGKPWARAEEVREVLRNGRNGQQNGRNGHIRDRDDEFALPTRLTYAGLLQSAYKTYFHGMNDEARRRSREESAVMKRDPFLMGMVQERRLSVSSLKWDLEVPDEKDPRQAQVRDHLTDLCRSVPRLRKLIRTQQWATWYGRYGIQWKPRWADIDGIRSLVIERWKPVNGDKILYGWDDVPHIEVTAGASDILRERGAEIVNAPSRDNATAIRLGSSYWRERFQIHTHEVEDSDFMEWERAENIHGVGIRDVIYWLDWVRREFMAWIAEYLQRVGLGLTIWEYEQGNDEAKQEMLLASKQFNDRVDLVIPKLKGGGETANNVRRIEVPTAGAEVLQRLQEPIRQDIERYIIGQEGSSKGTSSGLGNEANADMMANTKLAITMSDAEDAAETMTGSEQEPGLVWLLQKYTFPKTLPGVPGGFRVHWKFRVEKTESQEKLSAIQTLVGMGVKVRADDARGAAGVSKPTDDDEVVGPPGMPGMPGDPAAGGMGAGPMGGVAQTAEQMGAGQGEEEHQFASAQFNLADAQGGQQLLPAIQQLAQQIPDEALAGEGREQEPHITALYGLHGADPAQVAQAVQGFGPIRIRLGKTAVFSSTPTTQDPQSQQQPGQEEQPQQFAGEQWLGQPQYKRGEKPETGSSGPRKIGFGSDTTQGNWIQETSGPKGQHYSNRRWKNVQTGEVQYSDSNPGHSKKTGSEGAQDPAAAQNGAGEQSQAKPDVVYVEVQSEDLTRLNQALAKLDHTQTQPQYTPHITLAYVQPGMGKKFAGSNALAGKELVLTKLLFSDPSGQKTPIVLTGAKQPGQPGQPDQAAQPLAARQDAANSPNSPNSPAVSGQDQQVGGGERLVDGKVPQVTPQSASGAEDGFSEQEHAMIANMPHDPEMVAAIIGQLIAHKKAQGEADLSRVRGERGQPTGDDGETEDEASQYADEVYYFAAVDWVHDPVTPVKKLNNPRRWKSAKSGRVVYADQNPGLREDQHRETASQLAKEISSKREFEGGHVDQLMEKLTALPIKHLRELQKQLGVGVKDRNKWNLADKIVKAWMKKNAPAPGHFDNEGDYRAASVLKHQVKFSPSAAITRAAEAVRKHPDAKSAWKEVGPSIHGYHELEKGDTTLGVTHAARIKHLIEQAYGESVGGAGGEQPKDAPKTESPAQKPVPVPTPTPVPKKQEPAAVDNRAAISTGKTNKPEQQSTKKSGESRQFNGAKAAKPALQLQKRQTHEQKAAAQPAKPTGQEPSPAEIIQRYGNSTDHAEQTGTARVRTLDGIVQSGRPVTTQEAGAAADALKNYAKTPAYANHPLGKMIDSLGRQILAKLPPEQHAEFAKPFLRELGSEHRRGDIPPAIQDFLRQHMANQAVIAENGETTVGALLGGGQPGAPATVTRSAPVATPTPRRQSKPFIGFTQEDIVGKRPPAKDEKSKKKK